MDKKGLRIPTHKTPQSQRGNFVFHSVTEEITITAKQVGAEWVKKEHTFDDREVDNNCKNGHPTLTEQQKAQKKEWEEAHPGEEYPSNWNLSTDANPYDPDMDDDKQPLYAEILRNLEGVDNLMEWLHEAAERLTGRSKLVYDDMIVNEKSVVQISAEWDVDDNTVYRARDKMIADLTKMAKEDGMIHSGTASSQTKKTRSKRKR